MENESLPKSVSEQIQEPLDRQDEELVRRTARNAEKLAVALGLPREAKYAVLSALGGSAVEAFTSLKETYGDTGANPPASIGERPDRESE